MLIEGAIAIAIGLYTTTVGFGYMKVSRNPLANEQFMRRFGTLFRIGGPVAVIHGIVVACRHL